MGTKNGALINLVLRCVDNYAYPGFCIRISDGRDELDFGAGVFGRFCPTRNPTDRALDAYHHELLHSDSAHRNLAGLASVVYWGYATYSHNYARGRVTWLLHGHGRRAGVTPDAAALCLLAAREAVAQGRYDEALGEMQPLCQLSRTPFASKIIAFLCPDHAGVYDNRIQRGLVNHPILDRYALPGRLFEHCGSGVGAVASPVIRQRYQAWCEALSQVASEINNGRKGPRLRALDIERAIFAAIGAL